MKWRTIVEYTLERCGSFPKNVRFSLCQRLTNLTLDVMELIVEAIYTKARSDILRRANLCIEKIRVLWQISVNRRYISVQQYGYIGGEIDEAGRMVGGWRKQCKE